MSGTIQTDQYEVNEALADNNLIEVFQPSSGGIRREKKGLLSVLKTFFLNPRSFISGRFDSQEFPESGSLTAGTYTIAETEDTADLASGCQLRIVSDLGIDLIEIDFKESTSAKTHQNTKIELLNAVIGNFKLAKSDSVNGAGAKIQIILPSTTTLKVQLISNIGNGAGWQLVTPTSSGIGLCPDGVTAATFLEAGEELSFNSGLTVYPPNWTGRKVSDDIMDCSIIWPEIPKKGTVLTITLPTTSLIFREGAGTSGTVTGSHTISSFGIIGKHANFRINETGAFAALSGSLISFPQIDGTDCKLTIT